MVTNHEIGKTKTEILRVLSGFTKPETARTIVLAIDELGDKYPHRAAYFS